jgi:hypothetical protein
MRQIFFFITLAILVFGLYLKFFYDVPDIQEVTNMWVSWLLLILGIMGIVVSVLWKKKRNPLMESSDNSGA